MRGLLAVAAMSFRTWWRDKSSAFWGVILPLLIMGLIGSAWGEAESLAFTVSFVWPPGGATSPAVVGIRQALGSVDMLQVIDEPKDRAVTALREGDRTLVLEPTPGAGGSDAPWGAQVDITYDQARDQMAQAAIAVVREVLRRAEQAVTGSQELFPITTHTVTGKRLRMFDFLLPGILAMSIAQTGLMGVSWSVADYRERRVLKRVLATPFHPLGFLGGLLARFTLVTLFQAVLILAVGVLVFKAQVVGSGALLLGLGALGSVAFLAVGFAISTLAPTAESANIIGSVINFPMMFLSGTFWPKEMMPDYMQPLVQALPLTPLVDAMRAVCTEGAGLAPFAGGLLYLAAWGAVALLVAAWRFRWE